MGGSHRGAADGVDGVLAANPGRENAETRAEDVDTFSPVGEVGTAIIKGRGSNGDGLGSSSGGVVASISVVIASGDGEVDTSIDSGVDNVVESRRLATTKRHVGGGTLEALALAVLGQLHVVEMLLCGILDALDDIGHGSRAIASEHLDGVDMSFLGNTVLSASNGTGAVSTVAVTILILVASGDGLAPEGTTLEVHVLDVGAGVNDVDVHTLTTVGGVQVLVECSKRQARSVGDSGQSPRGTLLDLRLALLESVNDGVLLNKLDLFGLLASLKFQKQEWDDCKSIALSTHLGLLSDLLDGGLVEVAGITEEVTDLERVAQAAEELVNQRGLATLSEL